MKNVMEQDKRRRLLVSKQELKRLKYKSLIQDRSLSWAERWEYVVKLNNLSRNGSAVRIRNRCILTGRARSTYRFCKLSRISFRDLAGKGSLIGIRKASW